MVKSIESLPNIDPALAKELKKVGIMDGDALIRIGAEHAWQRLMRNGWNDGLHSLLQLEGAIEGVRSSQVPLDRQQELRLEAIAYSQGR
ncbi:MAG TPA: TfoX/Sxy family DNA transformation protein [Chthoniobacterales bacterium]